MLNTIANDVTEKLDGVWDDKQRVRVDRDMIDKIWNFSNGNPLLLQHLATSIAKNSIDSARRRLSRKDGDHQHRDSEIDEKDRSLIVMRRDENGQRLVSFRENFDVEKHLNFPDELHSCLVCARSSLDHTPNDCQGCGCDRLTFSFDQLCGWWPKEGNEEMLAREVNRMKISTSFTAIFRINREIQIQQSHASTCYPATNVTHT